MESVTVAVKHANRTKIRKPGIWRAYWKHKYLALLLLPTIVYFLVFHYVPIYGIQIAFKNYRFLDGINGSPWAGLEHFRYLFSLDSFWTVLRNTLVISFLKLLIGFPAPILFALLLNELRHLLVKRFVQTVSFFPHFLSWIILSGVLIQLLSPSIGPINHVIRFFGHKPIFFLADPSWFRWVLVVTDVWKDLGWSSIVYLAAIAGIHPELYEVAKVDGANRLQRMLNITLPGIAPVITIMLILNMGKLIQDDFDQVFNLLNPAVYQTGDVLSTYTYRAGVEQLKYSFATAVGLFKNTVSLALVLAANGLTKRFNQNGLW